jgi:hypothetical protein
MMGRSARPHTALWRWRASPVDLPAVPNAAREMGDAGAGDRLSRRRSSEIAEMRVGSFVSGRMGAGAMLRSCRRTREIDDEKPDREATTKLRAARPYTERKAGTASA